MFGNKTGYLLYFLEKNRSKTHEKSCTSIARAQTKHQKQKAL
jgi:hypothetical protein